MGDRKPISLRQNFDLGWLSDATRHLASCDNVMFRLVERFGMCGLTPRTDRFAALAAMIIGQQLSKAAADTIRTRVIALTGSTLSPESLLSVGDASLRQAGLSSAKVDYIIALSRGALSGAVDLDGIPDEDNEAVETLCSQRGVGRWTAHMFMIFVLGRRDILPFDDVAIRRSVAELYGISKKEASSRLPTIAKPWSPYRSAACWYLYAHINGGKPPSLG